jgi:hypothetical protein
MRAIAIKTMNPTVTSSIAASLHLITTTKPSGSYQQGVVSVYTGVGGQYHPSTQNKKAGSSSGFVAAEQGRSVLFAKFELFAPLVIPDQESAQDDHPDFCYEQHRNLADNDSRQMPALDLCDFSIHRRGGTIGRSLGKFDVMTGGGFDHFVAHIWADDKKQGGQGDDDFVSEWHRGSF